MSKIFSFKNRLQFVFITLAAAIVSAPYAKAESYDLSSFDNNQPQQMQPNALDSLGATGQTNGAQNNQPNPRQNYQQKIARFTSNQALPLAIATRTVLSQRSQQLPKTTLDSFVYQAGGNADQIYGDEGENGPPPFSGMDSSHTIGSALNGGLTTGHQSNIPGAWTTYF